ncbi:hypothetical protein GCM10027268_05310 [Brachybacterium huguangmaarense]
METDMRLTPYMVRGLMRVRWVRTGVPIVVAVPTGEVLRQALALGARDCQHGHSRTALALVQGEC